MMVRKYLFLFFLFSCCSSLIGAQSWSTVKTPSAGTTRIYGGFANGCFSGAQTLPLDGVGYQQVRPSRNRNYGHIDTLTLIQRLGSFAAQRNQTLVIGDLSQPRGGPMSFGHSSHQTGLDIDIWFADMDARGIPAGQRESLKTPSVVTGETGHLNHYWRPFFRDLLYQTATQPNVERIFVNPVIKQALCEQESDPAWLRKLRPWWGHDSHFHIRLSCPPDQPFCVKQNPIPAGSGCDSDLLNWVNDQIDAILHPKKKTAPAKKKKKAPMPMECSGLLNEK